MEKLWKWKYTITKMIFWPKIKCDVLGNILMHTQPGQLCAQGWVVKGHGKSLIYRGKVMEFKGSERP